MQLLSLALKKGIQICKTIVKQGQIIKYEDDSSFIEASNFAELTLKGSYVLSAVEGWILNSRLILNTAKTSAVFFFKTNRVSDNSNIILNNLQIPFLQNALQSI